MRAERILLVALVLGTLGCGSSPPVRYYALDAIPGSFSSSPSDVILGIGPINFPDYLKRPQIVTRSGATGLEVAEFDRWGEPLDAAFVRTLTAEIGTQLSEILVIRYPFGGGRVDADYRLLAQVGRFDVDATGAAVLDVSWGISTAEGTELAPPRRVQYRGAGADPDDYDSVVRAMQEALVAFSRDVANVFLEATG